MEMQRLGGDLRARLQQPARLLAEEVGIAAHLVHGPARGLEEMRTGHARDVDQMVEDVPGTHGFPSRALRGQVVDLADLHCFHIPVMLEGNVDRLDLAPPICDSTLDEDLIRFHDQVRLDPPAVFTHRIQLHLQVRRVALRRAVVGPGLDLRELLVRQRRVLLVVLDADVLLDIPRRHRAHAVPDRRLVPDPRGVPSNFLIVGESHGARPARAVALHAAPCQNRRDVLRERHRTGIDAEVGGREDVRLVQLTRRVGLRRQSRRCAQKCGSRDGDADRSDRPGNESVESLAMDRHGTIPPTEEKS